MTIGEVVDPVLVPIAFGIAVVATLFLFRHLGRRYRSLPKRGAFGFELDGRPTKRIIPRATLWAGPVVLALSVVALGIILLFIPLRGGEHVIIALVFVAMAEVAWLLAWGIDRQIEIARKITYRIPPARLLRALTPLLATIVVMFLLSVHP